ncbi:MAG: helix-turn-helix transcriptional regulator [Clostridia bacterium]|nr:helix-turn-helix transcriptional regulator [Clostridia bacterium]
MKIKIAENIKSLRKQYSFTQEQLAEALGVTVGAVYKWESGQSMPEVKLIMELADLFEISIDTLLGYDRQNENIANRIARLKQYIFEKDFDEAVLEAEKALKKYPNNFEIVYVAAMAYMFKFSEEKDEKSMLKSNGLFHSAISLLYQNKESSINETTIRNMIALNHLNAGQTEKGLELLKQNNICDINSARIGFTYAVMKQPLKARTHLYNSFVSVMNNTIHTMGGMVLMFAQQKDEFCIDAAIWLMHYFDSIKEDKSSIIFIDKLKAILYAQLAVMTAAFGRYCEAEKYIADAYNLAVKFDAAPVYTTQGIKFLKGEDRVGISLDGLGETALDGIESFIFANAEPSQSLDFVKNRFEELKNEEEK